MRLAALTQPLGSTSHLAALGVAAVSLFLALFFSAQAGILVLTAAWLAVGTWRAPWTSFLLLIAVAPFLVILKATVVLGALTLLKDVVILTLFARVVRDGGVRLPRSLAIPILTLIGWAIVAFLAADSRTLGLLRLRDLLLYVPLILVSLRLVTTPDRLRMFLAVFLGTATLVLLLGLVQALFFADGMVLRFDPDRSVWIPRASSVLAHPNILGGTLLFVVPLAAALAVTRRVPVGLRTLSVLLLAAGLFATYATYSRSAWIAIAVSLVTGGVLFVALRQPRLVARVLLASLLVGAAGLLVHPVRTFLASVVDPAYESNRTRLEILVGSLAGVSDRGAVIGEGLGDAVSLLGRTADISLYELVAAGAREAQVAKARTFVDNAVAKTWVEQGIVGVVLAAWVGLRLFGASVQAVQRATGPEVRALNLAVSSILVGLAALWLFLDVPDIFPVNLYFWTFMGLMAASGASRASKDSAADPS